MAVRVPAGKTSDIVFSYSTPGLGLGACVTGTGGVLFILYMIVWKAPVKKKKVYMNYIEDDISDFDSDYHTAELLEKYQSDVMNSASEVRTDETASKEKQAVKSEDDAPEK